MTRPRVAVAVAAIAALVLVGWKVAGDDRDDRKPTRVMPVPIVAGKPECISSDGVDGGTLPAGTPAAVVECEESVELVPGDGEWWVHTHRRATNVGPLLATLRLPWEPRHDGICGDIFLLPGVLVLEVNGGLFSVTPPQDGCGQPLPEVIAAYGALRWTETGVEKVTRTRTETSVTAGCSRWPDKLAMASDVTDRPDKGDVPTEEIQQVCRNRSVYPAGWKPGDTDLADAEALGGFAPTPEQAARIAQLIDGAGPAKPCDQWRHREFAAVQHDGTGEATYVELDGCLRILARDDTFRQGTAELVTLLTTPTPPGYTPPPPRTQAPLPEPSGLPAPPRGFRPGYGLGGIPSPSGSSAPPAMLPPTAGRM